ncbi:hydrogenase iron-sulfur subunit [Desulfosporosinus sp. PR]|uniref:hydrogenase iron-sulfur subunit n=1 Tax=Candidatus Desulfosporosinus nitrosoreducens TaxID=3401928 RepID=UPI0027FBAB9B|nr:hydrogenase iron-sulfur subunit [Desulfosporosinus sp. PR]MDQ7094734.1 hydrogenase iron-sulfur subunit [Desulfosporosinus sp. PR]
MPNSVDVVLCRCPENPYSQLELERLSEKLAKNKKISRIHIVEQLCSIAGTEKFAELVRSSRPGGLVVGACAAETLYQRLSSCLKKADSGKTALVTVPLRELVLWSYCGQDTLQSARDLIKMAVSKVRKSADKGNADAGGAAINYLKCDKCKRCMEECPVGAYSLNSEGYPQANQDLCQRCGICVGSCPIQCISLPNLRIEELSAEIRALKGDGSAEPTLLAFCCEPLTYPALLKEIAWGTALPANMRIIKVPCMGAVNAALINDALSSGIDGVLLLGCEQGSCKIRQGNILAKQRLDNLKETLTRMMIEKERVQYLGWQEKKKAGIYVNPELCTGCLICQKVCPFNAVVPERKSVRGEERLVSGRDEAACRSCGICAANCPSGACQTVRFNDSQFLAALDSLCSKTAVTFSSDTAILCSCAGKLEQYIDFQELEKALYRQGFGQVLVLPQLCSAQAWQEVKAGLKANPSRGVVAACAKDFFGWRMQKYQRDVGLEPEQWSCTDLWEKAMVSPADRNRAAELGLQDVLAGLSALSPGQSGVRAPEDGEESLFQQQINAYAGTIGNLGPNPLKE